MIHIKELRSGLPLFKALGSDIRIEILQLLSEHHTLNLNDLAQKLNLSNGAVTMHIKKLEESGLIDIQSAVGKHGIQKICRLNEDKLIVELRSREAVRQYEVEIPIGHYSSYHALPTCGLATRERFIGGLDDPRYFADPGRIDAEIIWLSEGYLEYRIPNYLNAGQRFKEIQFSMELSSEAPGYCEQWPSDIYFYLNDFELGFWTSPGDFGETRGTFNPDWWPSQINQYGMLKWIRVNEQGSFIDGHQVSGVGLKDIALDYKSPLRFKIGVGEKSVNKGGFTVYGKHFGNYNQDLLVRVLYDESRNGEKPE